MATFVVIDYESESNAEEVRLALLKMQKEYLIDLADAVVVVRDASGKVRLRQTYNLTAADVLSGGFWGTLIGLIFLDPLFGFVIGASAGAVSQASDIRFAIDLWRSNSIPCEPQRGEDRSCLTLLLLRVNQSVPRAVHN